MKIKEIVKYSGSTGVYHYKIWERRGLNQGGGRRMSYLVCVCVCVFMSLVSVMCLEKIEVDGL